MGDPIRPPAEAGSVILQATTGCPHNRCAFCAAYRGVGFRVRGPDEFEAHARLIAALEGNGGARVFLADGDTMRLPTARLLELVEIAKRVFPDARRFSLYAGARGILAKSGVELARLKEAGFNTLYLGLESGSEEILRNMEKDATAAEMTEAVVSAQNAGLRVSVMALLGLGGTTHSKEHAEATAAVLNRMQPRLLSFLTLIPVPGTPLWARIESGSFALPDARGMLCELRNLVAGLELNRTVFTANHASSYLPLEGALPRDRDRLLAELDAAIAGSRRLVPEVWRGL
ncbi:MAG TPA: radical SAM protein [Candidatus Ozemobacteraceae bacterium]|nr:radical SAM protein [Candidatus Ozemobacteraceae bacterium]HQG28478.1 radical SAM protein [Candidatus Ozemobacteraceae bacterium]